MDQEDMDLHMLIKQFLSKDTEFRNPNFDPAPYLIQILKDKSADHQAIIEKQAELIEQQNKAREIVEEICSENSADFLKFLDVPGVFAQNLEKLKSNVSVVKKKVKQTKALLLNTQKDIQQIHYNCMFNKKVYKQLKAISVRLQQYQTAYLALKNNQYYLCALNLPYVEGLTILQSTLASRAETLRLRMMSKAIDQLTNFLFFSPKVVLLSSNVLLDRMTENDDKNNVTSLMIANWDQQEVFFKRYKLFKKAFCLDYLSKIWEFTDLDRKQGKLGLMFDIIKGIIRISKIAQITSSIQIYGPKQISNTFLLLKCFRVKEREPGSTCKVKQRNQRWFVDRCTDDKQDREFISATLNIIGVLLRKAIIIHKIYQEFGQKDFQLNSGLIYKHAIAEMKKLIDLLYFPDNKNNEQAIEQNTEEQLNEQLRNKIFDPSNYINFGYSAYIMSKGFRIIEKNIIEIQQKCFLNESIVKNVSRKAEEMMAGYEQMFYTYFHRDFMSTLQEIYCKESQFFIVESFETIIAYKPFKTDEIKYLKGYKSDDRKAIKEFIFILSFMKALQEFFEVNNLNKARLYKYLLMSILFFYLKLNYHLLSHLIQPGELLVIEEQRKTDKKLKKKQEEVKRVFYNILTEVEIKQDKIGKPAIKTEIKPTSVIGISFHTTDKLKIIHRQNQMLLNFSFQFFGFVEEQKNSPNVEEYIRIITKLEPANYDEQIKAKLVRVWEALPDSEKSLKQFLVAVFYKLVQVHYLLGAKIYRETGLLI